MTTMLASREQPPEKPTAMPTQGSFQFEPTYTGNVGNDMGISTMGYRSAKYNPPEWHETNYAKYYQSFADRDNSERVRHDAKTTIKETDAITEQAQAESTKKLGERLKDINFWKFELNREIQDMISETDLLLAQKKRLENALRATEIPLHIATDNLNCRNRRQGVDLVQDDVELNLLKEVEVINNVQDLLKRTIKESDDQIKRNRDRKQELEMDWSDKKEADEIDTFAGALRNGHTCKQFFAGSAKVPEIQSTPESWAQFTHDNITRAEHERMASIQLRTLVDNVLQDTSRDMREQADAVDMAFQKRVEEMQDAKNKLEENLRKVCDNITATEHNIEDLKKAIKDKEDPMKVAQTRLHVRQFRPNVENCRDPAQYSLVNEVNLIAGSVDALMQKLNDAEHALKDLQDNRMSLEKEISIKKNSIFIDKDKCMTHRTRYPSTMKLQGYQ
uniref:Tektin n=1 Tax=Platynereis dumerilii TaxID=6359 RepID=A0AA49K710_PLADU|nr:tektin 4 [Platynereis dumerilii]